MTRTERDALKKATEELAGETLPVPACIKSFYKVTAGKPMSLGVG